MKIIIIISSLLYSTCLLSQSKLKFDETNIDSINEVKSLLMGEWIFIELQNGSGQKVERIYHKEWEALGLSAIETVNRPNITFNINTFEKQFTAVNIDSGYWDVDIKTRAIKYQLYIDPKSEVGQDLIKRKLAKKADNGNYYEEVSDQIYHISNNQLVLKESNGHYMILSRKYKE